MAVGERHLRPTFKVTPMTGERPCARKRVEKWRKSRLTVRALRVYADVYACSRQRGGRRVPIKRGRILLFENVVKPPRFSKESMRLCNWGLFVRVTVHLEGRLRFCVKGGPRFEERGRIRMDGWGQMREIQTSPYSFVSHISKSGRRLPSCSLQRTMGCIVPDTPLKETEALSSRFAALVFAVKVRVSIGRDAHE